MSQRKNVANFSELGEPVQRSVDEWRYNCPWCEELTGKRSKGRLYFNIVKRIGSCWQCKTTVIDEGNFDFESLHLNYYARREDARPKAQRFRLAGWTRPALDSAWARKYLNKRGFNDETIEKYQFRAASSPKDCIILPDEVGPDLTTNFFQLRYMDPKAWCKYTNPRNALKPLYGERLYTGQRGAFVCEGIFSAISCGANVPSWAAFATYGKAVTSEQMERLVALPVEDYCVVYDGGEISASLNTAYALMQSTGKSVRFLTLPFKEDPNSLIELGEYLNQAVLMTEVSHRVITAKSNRLMDADAGDWDRFVEACSGFRVGMPP